MGLLLFLALPTLGAFAWGVLSYWYESYQLRNMQDLPSKLPDYAYPADENIYRTYEGYNHYEDGQYR